jgi:hypothetical protein
MITDLLMLRCEAEGRASKHAPAVGRCIGRVASFEAPPGSSPGVAPQDEGLGRMAQKNNLHNCDI